LNDSELYYIAPEVIESKKYSEKSDVYAFGSVLLELFLQKE
jgi:serine/threonine protein kinase